MPESTRLSRLRLHRLLPLVCALFFGGASIDSQADLVHRWSFDQAAGPVAPGTTFTDSIGNATATLRGIGATSNGSSTTLPGNQGLPTQGGPQTLTGPKPGANSFFRARVSEN